MCDSELVTSLLEKCCVTDDLHRALLYVGKSVHSIAEVDISKPV